MPEFHVHSLPGTIRAGSLVGATAVVVDVLRASTTISAALAAGARAIVPCLKIEEAQAEAARRRARGDRVLLGGERGGSRIEGFDLGNSPAEYTADCVSDATIVFTTTNGTRALAACDSAARVVIGSFVNLSAVVAALRGADVVHVVCAGTRGQVSREDTLLAGALLDRLAGSEDRLDDEGRLAIDDWHRLLTPLGEPPGTEELARVFADCAGGRDLVALERMDDLYFAASIDRLTIVPQWQRASGEIRAC